MIGIERAVARDAIRRILEEISERAYSAGWMADLEHQIWRRIVAPERVSRSYGQDGVTIGEQRFLLYLTGRLGEWLALNTRTGELEWVGLRHWRSIHRYWCTEQMGIAVTVEATRPEVFVRLEHEERPMLLGDELATRHVAGEATDHEQRCVRCGALLADFEGVRAPGGQLPERHPKGANVIVWRFGIYRETDPETVCDCGEEPS